MMGRTLIVWLMVLLLGGCSAEEAKKSGGAQTDFLVDASAGWVYVSLKERKALTLTETEAANDATWDIAMNGAKMRTNSGVSGPGQGGANDPNQSNVEDLTNPPADSDFVADKEYTIQAGPSPETMALNAVLYGCTYITSESCSYEGWYDYDPNTFTVSPKDKAFWIKGGDGSLYRFKVIGYSNQVYNLKVLEP